MDVEPKLTLMKTTSWSIHKVQSQTDFLVKTLRQTSDFLVKTVRQTSVVKLVKNAIKVAQLHWLTWPFLKHMSQASFFLENIDLNNRFIYLFI